MDPLGLKELEKLPPELQSVATALLDRVAAIEDKMARDTSLVAKQVTDDLRPMVQQAVDSLNAVTQTVNETAEETLALVRRGITVTINWNPAPAADTSITVSDKEPA